MPGSLPQASLVWESMRVKVKGAKELAPDGVRGASRVGRLGVRMLAFSNCEAGSEGNGSEFEKV